MEGNLFDIIVDKLSEYLKVDKSNITIPDDVVDGLETVGDLVKYLETVVK